MSQFLKFLAEYESKPSCTETHTEIQNENKIQTPEPVVDKFSGKNVSPDRLFKPPVDKQKLQKPPPADFSERKHASPDGGASEAAVNDKPATKVGDTFMIKNVKWEITGPGAVLHLPEGHVLDKNYKNMDLLKRSHCFTARTTNDEGQVEYNSFVIVCTSSGTFMPPKQVTVDMFNKMFKNIKNRKPSLEKEALMAKNMKIINNEIHLLIPRVRYDQLVKPPSTDKPLMSKATSAMLQFGIAAARFELMDDKEGMKELVQHEEAFEDKFKEIIESISDGSGCTLYDNKEFYERFKEKLIESGFDESLIRSIGGTVAMVTVVGNKLKAKRKLALLGNKNKKKTKS